VSPAAQRDKIKRGAYRNTFLLKVLVVSMEMPIFATDINNFIMSNSRTITIKNPSRKLEEKIREAGVQKYLWLKELCSEETKPNKVIYV